LIANLNYVLLLLSFISFISSTFPSLPKTAFLIEKPGFDVAVISGIDEDASGVEEPLY
jgi:hypothetical protein